MAVHKQKTEVKPLFDRVIPGSAFDERPKLPDSCIDLIVTSPPYADKRKQDYETVSADEYVEWFLPLSAELLRVLKPTGSFVLNIKERVHNGQRHTYVIELILAMVEQGWLWTEEYIWHKKNCYPGKWPNRFRDAWERCLHFTKEKNFRMHQENVMVPIGDWSKTRLRNLGENDVIRNESKSKSGFGKNIANWLGKRMVYPTNVLHFATECSNKMHSAAFPEQLPGWFIDLFTESGDVVLDPFLGSGTTAVAAIKRGRRYIGIEINDNYAQMANSAVESARITFGIFVLEDFC